jgi:hypothetical protein
VRRLREVLTPSRALSVLLVFAGAALVAVNASFPDESRWMGAATLVVGLVLLFVRETARRRATQQTVAATLLVLFGGEIAVRHENANAQRAFADRLVRFVDDPELRYELVPGVACDDTSTNDLGMVDVPRSPPKPEGTLRIACLGDSVGADCSLPRATACADLETILRERRGGRPTEALNFSVFGYNTLQEARALETKAAPFRPDAVVVLYVVNDPFPDLAVSHHLPGHLKFEHLLFSGATLAATRALGASVEPLPGLRSLYDEPRAWDGVVRAGFDRIAKAAAALGAPAVVAVFPVFAEPRAAYADIYARVAREAAEHGLVGVDLSLAAYRDVPLDALLKLSRDAIHPNALAHRLAAEAIASALVAASPRLLER